MEPKEKKIYHSTVEQPTGFRGNCGLWVGDQNGGRLAGFLGNETCAGGEKSPRLGFNSEREMKKIKNLLGQISFGSFEKTKTLISLSYLSTKNQNEHCWIPKRRGLKI